MNLAVVALAAATAASGCFISPIIPIGSGKSAKQAQRDTLDKFLPAQLTAPTRYTGDVRVAKARVYADDDYRAQNIHWQAAFDDQLDYANQILIPMCGVRVEAEYRAWQRHAPDSTLADHLEALTRQDPGEDVVWVIGLTSSLSLAAATFEQLGYASVGRPYLVLRGYADLEERRSFEQAFPDVPDAHRATVLEARRRHKTTTVLLHELAHSLGALHEVEADWVMNAHYSHRASAIHDRNRELMLITLEDRLKPAAQRDAAATARRVLTTLETSGGTWDHDDREALVTQLREYLASPGVGTAASPVANGTVAPVPAEVQDQVTRAEQQLAGGNPAGAHATLEPLLVAYPAHARLRVLDCKIELARGGARSAAANTTCDRAAALSADIEPAIEVAVARRAAGDAGGAGKTLVAAEGRLASLPAARAPAAWITLAQTYRDLGQIT
jgi:hypothetical protein